MGSVNYVAINWEEKQKRYRAMKIVDRARHQLDRQKLPPREKMYIADHDEIMALLDVGADVKEYSDDGKKKTIVLEYEAIIFINWSDSSTTHPKLPSIKKAG